MLDHGLDSKSPSWFKNDVLYDNLIFKDVVWWLTSGPHDKEMSE